MHKNNLQPMAHPTEGSFPLTKKLELCAGNLQSCSAICPCGAKFGGPHGKIKILGVQAIMIYTPRPLEAGVQPAVEVNYQPLASKLTYCHFSKSTFFS